MKTQNLALLIIGGIIIAAILLFYKMLDYIPLTEATPEYIKEVVVYKEGADGLVVYFVLADAQGAMVCSSGTATLIISDTSSNQKTVLYDEKYHLSKEHFHRATVGLGAFKRKVILCSFGRLTYSSFEKLPDEDSFGKVEVQFRREPDGRILEGSDTIYF